MRYTRSTRSGGEGRKPMNGAIVERALEALRRIGAVHVPPRPLERQETAGRQGAASAQGAARAPTTAAEAVAQYENQALRRAALLFVNKAGARLLAVCPECTGDIRAEYAIMVPHQNDTPEFRDALRQLRLSHLPVITRHDPIDHLPARCEHVRPAKEQEQIEN
jgi:hypothetical protein